MNRRFLPYVVALLIVAVIAAGVGLVLVATSGERTATQVEDNSATNNQQDADSTKQAAELARLRSEVAKQRTALQREAAERARLRSLVASRGGDPGPDLSQQPPQSSPAVVVITSPSPYASPSPSPPHASPSPSPTCRRPLPILGCPRPAKEPQR